LYAFSYVSAESENADPILMKLCAGVEVFGVMIYITDSLSIHGFSSEGRILHFSTLLEEKV